MNYNRTTRIERMMSRGENLIVKQTGIELQKEPVVMNEEKYVFAFILCEIHVMDFPIQIGAIRIGLFIIDFKWSKVGIIRHLPLKCQSQQKLSACLVC